MDIFRSIFDSVLDKEPVFLDDYDLDGQDIEDLENEADEYQVRGDTCWFRGRDEYGRHWEVAVSNWGQREATCTTTDNLTSPIETLSTSSTS